MRPSRFHLLLLLPLMFLLMGARQAPLTDPDPVAVPAGMKIETVEREIKRALIGRGWTITSEQDGMIDSALNVRAHSARVRISYDSSRVALNYVSSDNLAYEEKRGERYIHKNYASWINNVMSDLSRGLQLAAIE